MAFQVINRGLQSLNAVLKASQAHVAKTAKKLSRLIGAVVMVKVQSRSWVGLFTDGAFTALSSRHLFVLLRRQSVAQALLIFIPMITAQICLSVLSLLFGQRPPLFVAISAIARKTAFLCAVSLKLPCKSHSRASGAFLSPQLNRLISSMSRLDSGLAGFGFHPTSVLISIARRAAIVMAVFVISTGFIKLIERFGLLTVFASLVWYSLASHSLNLLNVLKLWLGRLKSYLGRPSPLYHTTLPSFTVY